ncbi:hypothetical protein HID58_045832 [Brassica napus]|uniref:MADS-box domain-containing protein n=3 Tax=Brassica TaxID=3705 RepID=A0ABQ8AUT6_BRANA|nr:hypothetical protein HID58_045832 [Brassica napus]
MTYQYREIMRKTKGRQKTKMVKIEKEKYLQVTFCKRKNGLFKKANELCTLCNARVAIILFSPSGKICSFGHTKVETIIDRFEKTDHPDNNTQRNMQLGEIHQNSTIRGLNNRLTKVMKNLESEQKTKSIGGLDLGQAKEFKGKLENLKKQVIYEAFKIFLATPFPHPGFYGGSSSNAPFGVDCNMNAFDNHNMVLPNNPSPFGNYSLVEGFVPRFNHSMALPNGAILDALNVQKSFQCEISSSHASSVISPNLWLPSVPNTDYSTLLHLIMCLSLVYRYRVGLSVSDQTDEAVFVAFDLGMAKLTNIQPAEATHSVGVNARVDKDFPQFIADIGDNHGSDDHAPRGVPVASADEINTVSEEAGGVTADLGVAANANQEPSSSVIERPASTNPILDLNENFEQRRMVNVNAFHNHNMVLPNHPSPFGNYSRVEGFVPGFNHNMALPSHHNPNESGNEHPHDGHPPQPRSD